MLYVHWYLQAYQQKMTGRKVDRQMQTHQDTRTDCWNAVQTQPGRKHTQTQKTCTQLAGNQSLVMTAKIATVVCWHIVYLRSSSTGELLDSKAIQFSTTSTCFDFGVCGNVVSSAQQHSPTKPDHLVLVWCQQYAVMQAATTSLWRRCVQFDRSPKEVPSLYLHPCRFLHLGAGTEGVRSCEAETTGKEKESRTYRESR